MTDRPQWIPYRGRKLYADTNDHVAGIIRRQGYYEQDVTEFIENQTSRGDLVIDVGAHIGHHSITIRQSICKEGELLLFEPNPRNSRFIKRTVSENGWNNVYLYEVALSNSEEVSTLTISDQNNTGSATTRNYEPSGVANEYNVQARRLSQILVAQDINQIDLLKMDIEGSEYEVLTDIEPELNNIKSMIAEIHKQKLENDEVKSIFEILSGKGKLYNIETLDDELESVSDINKTIVWFLDN